jgi:biopolymer transport protein ExbD
VFAKEVGIEVSRPGGGATSEGGKESKSMIVTIYSTGDIEIEGRMVDARAVRANVEKMHAVKPENGVMVVADKVVPSGLLVEVLDQIRLGGVSDISFGATK